MCKLDVGLWKVKKHFDTLHLAKHTIKRHIFLAFRSRNYLSFTQFMRFLQTLYSILKSRIFLKLINHRKFFIIPGIVTLFEIFSGTQCQSNYIWIEMKYFVQMGHRNSIFASFLYIDCVVFLSTPLF